jgi:hypothetical protein
MLGRWIIVLESKQLKGTSTVTEHVKIVALYQFVEAHEIPWDI